MYSRWLAAIVALLAVAATSASALVVDDFESGDLAAWNTEAPYYTTVSTVSPGAGGSSKALAIQETAGAVHSVNALAHRHFAGAQNWSGYTTLEFDADISTGAWDGYSILVYNDDQAVYLRGIDSTSTAGFRRVQFDISGIQRDKITEIVVYVNRTAQNSGQTLYLDNIQVTNNAVPTPPSEVVIADMETTGTDINQWTNYDAALTPAGKSATYQTSTAIITDGTTHAAAITLGGTSASAYAQYAFPAAYDFSDYTTLQFDAKLATGANPNGFSLRLYNGGDVLRNLRTYQGTGQKTRKFSPSATDYVTCYVDISGMTRDQLSSIMFYVNRTSANASQVVRIDNIKVTNNPVPGSPDVIVLDSFDPSAGFPTDLARWDAVYNVTKALTPEDAGYSLPYGVDLALTSATSTSPYARRSWIVSGQNTYDLCDYRSIMFEAKLLRNGATPITTTPMGFTVDIVNAVTGTDATTGLDSGDYQMPFHPVSYDESDWTTYAVDITGFDLDQLKWLRFYMNRCGTNGVGQTLRIDNIRASKEPAPPVNYSNVDDFEDGDITDWFYSSSHEYPTGSGVNYPGTLSALTTDASTGNYAIKITNNVVPDTFPGSGAAYCRKTMHAKWLNYPTLIFDAKIANSNTSAGFGFCLRNMGGYGPTHMFTPTNEWKTFRIDISGDRYGTASPYRDVRQEIIGMLFYVNMPGIWGTSQNGSQELYIDNIRLSTKPVPAAPNNIGALKDLDDGTYVTLDGKIVAGSFAQALPDRTNLSIMRSVVFIEEPDRSAAIPVVVADGTAPDFPAGSKVRLNATLYTDYGVRYLYATSIIRQDSDQTFPVPAPVGLTSKAVGDPPRGLNTGIEGFAGISTNGMLVTICGRVTGVGSSFSPMCSWRYIDDGSGVLADNGNVGVKVYDMMGGYEDPGDIGKYARATGFVINEPERDTSGNPTGRVIRTVWLKSDLAEPFAFIAE